VCLIHRGWPDKWTGLLIGGRNESTSSWRYALMNLCSVFDSFEVVLDVSNVNRRRGVKQGLSRRRTLFLMSIATAISQGLHPTGRVVENWYLAVVFEQVLGY
jgi:hypothetical protein